MRIEEIEGIGPANGVRLSGAGISTTEALLEHGATAAGRRNLAEATGISETAILEWVNHADLMRIDGVGSEYSDLLEAAGVDSPAELAQRNPANLAITFQEVVAARPGIVRRIPSEAEVTGWITQAGTLPKVVSHGGVADAPAAGEGAGGGAPSGSGVGNASAASAASDSTRPAALTGSAGSAGAASDTGLWARIKRLFGGS